MIVVASTLSNNSLSELQAKYMIYKVYMTYIK